MKSFFTVKHLLIAVAGIFLSSHSFAQLAQAPTIMGVTPEEETKWEAWVKNLYEPGITMRNDSMIISDEARRVALDTAYRKIIYRPAYNWQEAQYLMKRMQLKIGFWHLLNLYAANPANKEAVLKYILSFDQVMEMDRVLISVFYTYVFLDPAVSTIVNGRPNFLHPEIVENKLHYVNELVDQVLAQRAAVESKN